MAHCSLIKTLGWGQYDHIVSKYQILINRVFFTHVDLRKNVNANVKKLDSAMKLNMQT